LRRCIRTKEPANTTAAHAKDEGKKGKERKEGGERGEKERELAGLRDRVAELESQLLEMMWSLQLTINTISGKGCAVSVLHKLTCTRTERRKRASEEMMGGKQLR
jgi:hypothetical protein